MSKTNVNVGAVPYIIQDNAITVIIDNEPHVISKDSLNFNEALKAIRGKKWKKLKKLVNPVKTLIEYSRRKLEIKHDELYWNGRKMNRALTKRLVGMYKNGFDITPMVLFIKNLMKNPSCTAIEELYEFLESNALPLTDDGHFIAYKRVTRAESDNEEYGIKKGDLVDIYSGTIRNNIGDCPRMKRNEVDDDRNRTCSKGLHFASIEYINESGYGKGENNPIVLLKINPRDVVSIPNDYNSQKGRCCRYEVIGFLRDQKHMKEVEESVVYSSDKK